MNSTTSESLGPPKAIAGHVKMESTCGFSGLVEDGEGTLTDPSLTAEPLQAWYQEYMDANHVSFECDLIQAVRADELDRDHIQRRVQELATAVQVHDGLCANCRHDFLHWADLPSPPPWEPAGTIGRAVNTLELEAAAMAGCRYCALWLYTLQKHREGLNLFRKLEARLQRCQSHVAASFGIQSWATHPITGFLTKQMMWLNFPGKVATHSFGPGAVARMDSIVGFASVKMPRYLPNPLAMAKTWLEDCCATHTECHSQKTFDAPTRLLSIGNHDVKLVLTDELEECPPYATLSYCWGTKPFFMLTSETLGRCLGQIADSELPKTFQDAILIARGLGLSYIWIDALCIVQNDNADWLREAGRMRSVYGGSRVNIAATSALNAHQGCFTKADQHCSGFYAQVTTPTHCRTQAFFPDDLYEEYVNGPLARRGWTLQERLLPPRTLFCGDQGYFWQCRGAARSEFLPHELPQDGMGRQYSSLACPESEPWPWPTVVEQYSRGQLTHGADRLPALSGIATRQHEVTGDQYLAGMWRGDLVWQLAWHMAEPGEKTERPAWRAPTWSWASVDGAVDYDMVSYDREHQRWVYILEAWTAPSGPDRFGPVAGGLLTLGCAGLLCGRLGDGDRSVTFGACGPEAGPAGDGTMTIRIDTDCVRDDPARETSAVYLLPLLDAIRAGFDDSEGLEGVMALGIIIQRCRGRPGHFRRVGSFGIPDWLSPKQSEDCYGDFVRLLERDGRGVAKSECARILSDAELASLGLSDNEWKAGDMKPRYVITME